MLILHPTIYLGPTGESTDALLVREGRVQAVGDDARDRRRDGERVLEPDAACLFPGLADAHCHLWGLGRRAGSVELSGASRWTDVEEALRAVDIENLEAGWVLGRKWDEHDWEDVDSAADRDWRGKLDALFPQTPVCLHRVDHHAVIVNSAALERAGYTDGATAATTGGRVVRDDTGRLTGLLVDEAMDPVLDAIPPPGVDEDRKMFLEAADQYLDFGITCAHIARTEIDRIDMVRRLHDDDELPLRMHLFADGEDERLPGLLEEGPQHGTDGWLACRGVKYFADGALGSGGALLLDSYADGSSGLEVTSRGGLRDHAKALIESGWQMAVHAIGDRGARNVLDAYEAASASARNAVRPRLEHAQMLTDEDSARMGELSTIASIQPIHMYSDAAWADEVLDAEQLDRLFPWRRLHNVTTLAAGSDFPIEDPNPWHGIATAITRRDASGRIFHDDQALTRSEALAAYTTGAAFAAHWEDRLGQLEPGFAADVIALDIDPFRATPDEIWEAEVLATLLGGRTVDSVGSVGR